MVPLPSVCHFAKFIRFGCSEKTSASATSRNACRWPVTAEPNNVMPSETVSFLVVPTIILCRDLIIPVRARCPAQFLLIHLIAAKMVKLLIIQLSAPPCLLFPLSTNSRTTSIKARLLVLAVHDGVSSLNIRDKASWLVKTSKHMFSYILFSTKYPMLKVNMYLIKYINRDSSDLAGNIPAS